MGLMIALRRRSPLTFRLLIAVVAAAASLSCAKRYSADEGDWVGPRARDFQTDHDACKERMDAAPFRFRGDPRLIFLDCMERRGWYLKGRSGRWPPAPSATRLRAIC